jgi:hypothetical protein
MNDFTLPRRHAHSAKDVAKAWSLAPCYVRALAVAGKIPSMRIGDRWLIPDDVAHDLPGFVNRKEAA